MGCISYTNHVITNNYEKHSKEVPLPQHLWPWMTYYIYEVYTIYVMVRGFGTRTHNNILITWFIQEYGETPPENVVPST